MILRERGTLTIHNTEIKAWPYKASIDFVNDKTMNDIYNWLNGNGIKYQYSFNQYSFTRNWYFKNDIDATAFKLRWL